MGFRTTALLVGLMATCLTAVTPSEQRFSQFYAKQQASAPVKLSEESYRALTATPRDYSVAVLLTALESRLGCKMCREFEPEWDILSRSWTRGDKQGQSRLLLTTLDFTDGRQVFMSLGLQTAPVLMLFPATTGPHSSPSPEPLRYDFSTGAMTAEQVHSWISRGTPNRLHPPVIRPVNWARWVVSIVIIMGAVTATVTASPYVLPIIQSRNLWAAGSLIAILLFVSGHMYNQIRRVPYVVSDGHKGISYFASGFQSQYGLETQIIAAIYGVLAFCTISLAFKVPRIADPRTQKIAAFAWAGALFLAYSFLLSIFRNKNGGYPFALPPFM